MQEYGIPALVDTDPEQNITDLLVQRAAKTPDRVLFGVPGADGSWHDVSAHEFLRRVRALAKGFVAAGIQPGDRVAIMSKTRFEWSLTDFALWFAGVIPVPIYETSSPSQIAWILGNSGAVAAVVENEECLARLDEGRKELPAVAHAWLIDSGDLQRLVTWGVEVDDAEIERRRSAMKADTVATIIYTSGTTGRPKGAVLTHANFIDLSKNLALTLPRVLETGSTLLFVTLAHVFARFIEVVTVYAGVRVGHEPNTKRLVEAMESFQPGFLLAVPRVFEKVYNSTEQKAEAARKGSLFRKAARTAIAYSRAMDEDGEPPLGLRIKHAIFKRLIYNRILKAMGGRVEYAISGSAPLGERLSHFFRGIGVTVLEGYGLTESTAPTTVNTLERLKIGTVGIPAPGSAVRISDDGEVLLKGLNIATSYWENPEATAEGYTDDGWFRTGDLGSLDEDGFLTITGRKKDIIVTAGGKNVAPAILEDPIRANPLVSQVMVVGEGRPFIGALVTLDAEMLPLWLPNHGLSADMTVEEAAEDPTVRLIIQKEIDRANQHVSRAESIRKFTILPGDFSEAAGQLTPSMKIRRAIVSRDFADEIDRLYEGTPTANPKGTGDGAATAATDADRA